jgi:hypothetical protein
VHCPHLSRRNDSSFFGGSGPGDQDRPDSVGNLFAVIALGALILSAVVLTAVLLLVAKV